MTITSPASMIETDFLADSFLTNTGIIFDFNEREVLHSALTNFLFDYTTAVVTDTLESLARRAEPERHLSGVRI